MATVRAAGRGKGREREGRPGSCAARPRLIELRLCVQRRHSGSAVGKAELQFSYNLHFFSFKA